jgi:2-polyprenyl-3-methyl-5-hydroxy-6-metoxy-1,4-benzoquinol methylase
MPPDSSNNRAAPYITCRERHYGGLPRGVPPELRIWHMPSVQSYYEGQYATHRLGIDLATRRNRLAFCLDPSLSGLQILDVGCGPGAQLTYHI